MLIKGGTRTVVQSQLPLTSEVSHGNRIDRSFGAVPTGWWGLGILSLARVAPLAIDLPREVVPLSYVSPRAFTRENILPRVRRVLGFNFRSQKSASCAGTEARQPKSEGWVERSSLVEQGERMKSSTKNEAKGKFYEVKGKTKERWGKLMNDPTLEGKDENTVGRIQEKFGQGEKASKNGAAGK